MSDFKVCHRCGQALEDDMCYWCHGVVPPSRMKEISTDIMGDSAEDERPKQIFKTWLFDEDMSVIDGDWDIGIPTFKFNADEYERLVRNDELTRPLSLRDTIQQEWDW